MAPTSNNHSSEDRTSLAVDLVYNSYCPVASCGTLSALRHRKKEVQAWLKREIIDDLFLPTDFDPEVMQSWNLILIGKIRILECCFRVCFSWKGIDQGEGRVAAQSIIYRHGTLAAYYAQSASFQSRITGCSDCIEHGQTSPCFEEIRDRLWLCHLVYDTESIGLLEPGYMSRSQVQAWSFVVSLATLEVVGFSVDSTLAVSWCRLMLSHSRTLVETILRADRIWVGEHEWPAPPPYEL